jgi:hypothetical protein
MISLLRLGGFKDVKMRFIPIKDGGLDGSWSYLL